MSPSVTIKRRLLQKRFSDSSIHPVLGRVYAARDINYLHQIDRQLKGLHSYSTLKNSSEAAELLYSALSLQKNILIVGDFDADGATSSALAVRALQAFGCQSVGFLVPNRFDYGYGLTPEIVDVAVQRQPDLIVTVDNGISSIDGVAHARELGFEVLVTDHHLQGNCLPNANVIVNPNQAGDLFPSKNLAGVGVIFYVMLALRNLLREKNWFEEQSIAEPNMGHFLDLVALGTVADLVPLDKNNRVLVYQGIQRIRSGRACAGINALLSISKKRPHSLVASDLGFSLGPRLNAAGRLSDMSLGIACLLSDEPNEAIEMAKELDTLNRKRREIEAEMKATADINLEKIILEQQENELPIGLCLFDKEWHQGVIGILASRLKEKHHRPVIAFAAADNNELKGSARSIAGLHIRDLLEAIATRHPQLIKKFGGHAMAAGLTLSVQDFATFEQAFYQQLDTSVSEEMLEAVILTDGKLEAYELGLELAQLLRDSGPWGQGFPEPAFEGCFEIIENRIVGEKHFKMLLKPVDGETFIDAIAFNQADQIELESGQEIFTVYRLDVNDFNGSCNAQLIIEHLQLETMH